jgi:preprotein translocase subunit YajC
MEMIIILALAFGAMWLMTSRTRKQQRAAADFRANLEVGQEVMTGSGLYGTVVDVDGDVITLESTPGNRTRWIRAAVAKVVEPPVAEAADDDAELVDGESTVEDDRVIAVPDDLSTMPGTREDEDPDKK